MAYAKKEDAYKYNNEFINKKYDRINLTVPKGEKERIQAAANLNDESVNAMIWRFLKNELDRLGPEKIQAQVELDRINAKKGKK